MFIKNKDGSIDKIILTSNDNKNIAIGNNYKLVKFSNKKAFKDTLLGSDIGVHSNGFINITIMSTVIAISILIIMYVSFRI